MNDSEQLMFLFEQLLVHKINIDELKREIEELKYFNRILSYKLSGLSVKLSGLRVKLSGIPDFQSENKKTPIINGHS